MKTLIALMAASALATPCFAQDRAFVTSSVQPGDTVANTSTATVLTTRLNFPATDLIGTALGADARYGMAFDVEYDCNFSTLASAQGTLTLDVVDQTGASNAVTDVLGTTGAFTPPAGAANNFLNVKGFVVFNTTGTAGVATFFGSATVQGASNALLVYGMNPAGMSSGGTTGWNAAVSTSQFAQNGIGLRVTWQTASTSNTITCAAKEKVIF